MRMRRRYEPFLRGTGGAEPPPRHYPYGSTLSFAEPPTNAPPPSIAPPPKSSATPFATTSEPADDARVASLDGWRSRLGSELDGGGILSILLRVLRGWRWR